MNIKRRTAIFATVGILCASGSSAMAVNTHVVTHAASVTSHVTVAPTAESSARMAHTINSKLPSRAKAPGFRIKTTTKCSETMCLYVKGDGLFVAYAVVTNNTSATQRPYISSNYDGATHIGPTRTKNAAWRYDYNVTMRNGNKVCGSMEGIGVACAIITP